jgi:hypothetical protein
MFAGGISLGILGARRGWVPGNLSNLFAWFNAANSTVVGGKVSALADLSGHGRNAVQATSAKQPTYVASYQNGRPGVQFNAGSLCLVSTYGVTLAQTSEIWIVATITTPSGGASIFDGIDSSNRQSAAKTTVFGGQDLYMYASGGTPHPTPSPTWGVPHVYRFVFAGAASAMAIDGAAQTLTPAGGTGTQGSNGLTIGADNTGSGNPAGLTVGEVVVASGALGSTDAASLLGYLKGRWGIA